MTLRGCRRDGSATRIVRWASESDVKRKRTRHDCEQSMRGGDPAGKLWWIPLHLVTQLGLEERIAAWDTPREGISSKV